MQPVCKLILPLRLFFNPYLAPDPASSEISMPITLSGDNNFMSIIGIYCRTGGQIKTVLG
jgi:hypothetical protein